MQQRGDTQQISTIQNTVQNTGEDFNKDNEGSKMVVLEGPGKWIFVKEKLIAKGTFAHVFKASLEDGSVYAIKK